jgi:hypothetical protein
MATKIYGYQKVTNEYTTITLREPDRAQSDAPGITELCTIGGITYVAVPDEITLPEQPVEVAATLAEAVLTDELKEAIKAASPHVQLINERVVERIRQRYGINEELKLLRLGALSPNYETYCDYVEECREWGRTEKQKIGL